MGDWKSKYKAEERNLLAMLRRIYALTNQRDRLQWELTRCLNPHEAHSPKPPKADKPELLRKAEAGEPLIADVPRRKSDWEKSYRKLLDIKQECTRTRGGLTSEIRHLRKALAECSSRQVDHTEADSWHHDTGNPAPTAIEKKEASVRDPAPPARVILPEHEDHAAQLETLRAENRQLRQAMRVLEEEKQAFERQKQTWATQQKAEEEKREVSNDEIEELQKAYTTIQRRFDALTELRTLAESLQQGQRTFLDQHNNPQLDNALAGLADYSLAQLALALAEGNEACAQAMVFNLHTIAVRLQTYDQRIMHGFDSAVAWLQAQNVARYAEELPPATEQPGPEAKPFQVRLKYLRDVARVDLRPFYYIDGQGQAQRLG